MKFLRNLFKPRRVVAVLLLTVLTDPVLAQEPVHSGYSPAKLPRELHFMTRNLQGRAIEDPNLPFLVERGRDVAELRCEKGEPFAFQGEDDVTYVCLGTSTSLAVGGITLRFDRAPSPSPHLRMTIGGMGARVGCDIGTLRRLYEPGRKSNKFRCVDE